MKKYRDPQRVAPAGATRSAIAALAALLALAVGASEAAAQDIRAFRLMDIHGYAELGFRTDLTERLRSNSDDSGIDRIEFSQLLDISASAYIYHPSFLTLETSLRVEPIEDVLNAGNNRVLVGAGWRLNFLRERPTSYAIYGRVSESEFYRPFSKNYSVSELLFGGTIIRNAGWVPFTLSYQHRTLEGGSSGGVSEMKDSINFFGDYALAENSVGRLEYSIDFDDIQGRKSRHQNVIATNDSYFGDAGQNRLSTNFHFTERTDLGDLYTAVGSIDYDWRHTANLRTQYSVNTRWSQSDSQTLINVNPSFLLRHQLYDSLTSQLLVYARIDEASFGSKNEFGGRWSESYSKLLSEWGRLAIGASSSIVMTSTRPDQETAFVRNEVHVMRVGETVTLRVGNVVHSSIVVTNESGSITYDEDTGAGGDYRVISLGDAIQTELTLSIPSDIEDGQTVLVDYEYAILGESDILTPAFDVNASLLLFQHVRLFGRYGINRPNVLSGDEELLRINPFDRVAAGLVLDWPWLRASAEYEVYDARFGAFDGFSGSLALLTYGTRAWSASGNAGYSQRHFPKTDQTVKRMTVAANASVRLFRRGLLSFEANYLRERWSGTPNTPNNIDEFLVGAEYSWWFGQFELDVETGMAQYMGRSEDRRVYRIDFRARRSF